MSARYLSLLLVLSLFIAPTAGYASNDGSPDPVALRMAIEDLTETFGDEYPDGESYLAELDALEAASDAPDFASKLFDLQKRATLANPLLAQRRVLAVKRGANQIATPTLNAYVTEDVPKNIGSQIVSIDPVSGGYDVLFDS